MHLFVPPHDIDGGHAVIRGDDAHHLTRVLRAAPGMPLTVADGHGTVHDARVTRVDDQVRVVLTASRAVDPATPSVHVVHALPKRRKLDEVVQRLTELGVDRITPVHSDRSVVRLADAKAGKAHRRWCAVAHAGARQARRARLPVVDAVGNWDDHHWDGPGVVLWEEAATPLRDGLDAVTAQRAETVVLAVGPEGGLTAAEIDRCGLAPVGLGRTILRTEFASVAGVVATMTLLGRFA